MKQILDWMPVFVHQGWRGSRFLCGRISSDLIAFLGFLRIHDRHYSRLQTRLRMRILRSLNCYCWSVKDMILDLYSFEMSNL